VNDLALPALVGLLPVATFLAALLHLDSYKLVKMSTVVAVVACGGAVAGASHLVNAWTLARLGIDTSFRSRATSPRRTTDNPEHQPALKNALIAASGNRDPPIGILIAPLFNPVQSTCRLASYVRGTYVLSIRTFVLLMMWLAESVHAAIPLRMEVDSAYENGKVAIVGRTNLPDGTDLIARIYRDESNFSDDYKVSVAAGQFRVELFMNKGAPVSTGSYGIKITAPPVSAQPESVRRRLGPNYSNFSGPSIKWSQSGTVLEWRGSIPIPEPPKAETPPATKAQPQPAPPATKAQPQPAPPAAKAQPQPAPPGTRARPPPAPVAGTGAPQPSQAQPAVVERCPTAGLVPFPWPNPPLPSVTALVPRYLLFPDEGKATSLRAVGARLEGAISRAGYRQLKYLGAGCKGFVIVLDLEHIEADGRRMGGTGGFAPPSQEADFNLAQYVKRLFYAAPGYYRQIVIVVSEQGMTNATAAPTEAQLRAITRDGASSLPSAFANVAYTPRHAVYALIYEFEKGPRDGDLKVIPPAGRLGATVHLMKAKLF